VTVLSSMDVTLSFGAASVFEPGRDRRTALMASVTLMR
jgi:hypothetical protein